MAEGVLMGVNIGPIPERDDLDYISLRIYIKDGKLDQVVPEHPWEGQVSLQVVYQSFPGKLSLCQEHKCPEGPDAHWHDWMDVAVFRAKKS
jgi:hypothetical protein